ncbi:hypothetical protein [Actinomadura sp. WMMB 499]|uniref:hypothetical protein n=1 Tax=Actinomadura sp. WMMB 499 TaxID=1219491 RepID=UPI001248E8ED|nr:hypothetical protein [Actinomadura sp. WMMB 499]QFG23491.1 hypothetical protein F7P10_22595 [Actinomadura sp. WMMB 499]
MDTNARRSPAPAAIAALALLPPPTLAAVLRLVGPEYITTDVHPDLVLLYWAPPALMLVSGVAALAAGFVRRGRGGSGHRGLWATGAAGLVMVPPMLIFAFVCVYGASASELDGGWLPDDTAY